MKSNKSPFYAADPWSLGGSLWENCSRLLVLYFPMINAAYLWGQTEASVCEEASKHLVKVMRERDHI